MTKGEESSGNVSAHQCNNILLNNTGNNIRESSLRLLLKAKKVMAGHILFAVEWNPALSLSFVPFDELVVLFNVQSIVHSIILLLLGSCKVIEGKQNLTALGPHIGAWQRPDKGHYIKGGKSPSWTKVHSWPQDSVVDFIFWRRVIAALWCYEQWNGCKQKGQARFHLLICVHLPSRLWPTSKSCSDFAKI
jgi:hypothetical protein